MGRLTYVSRREASDEESPETSPAREADIVVGKRIRRRASSIFGTDQERDHERNLDEPSHDRVGVIESWHPVGNLDG